MRSQTGNTFDVKDYDANGLVFSTPYYWRIDESNGVTTYRGKVWRFTTAAYLTVDDFDSYASHDELWAVWDDYVINDSGATINVEKDSAFAQDGNSLVFVYDNWRKKESQYVGSFIDADIVDLEIGPDWTVSDARALVLYFYGQEDNSATVNDKMWVELEDTSSNTGVVIYDGDPNDVKEASWHEWNIDLGIFDACGVSLTNLDKVHFGFGNFYRTGQAEEGGSGTVWFDDIQVWPQRCVPVKASVADFTDDCIVDGYDLETMIEDWLMRDYNTLGYMGTLKGFPPAGDPNYDLAWVSGKIGTGALLFGGAHEFDPLSNNNDSDDYVEVPPLNLNTNAMSITLWAKRSIGGDQDDDGGLFFCSFRDDGPGTTESGFVIGLNNRDNWLNYNWNNESGAYNWSPEPDFNLPEGQWAFCALTIAPTYARIYIKKEGEAGKSDTNTYDHVVQAFGIPSRIGDHKERNFMGAIDDFRIYDRTLSIAEVEWLAYAGSQGTDPTDANLYAHYEFEDGGGLTALDSAGDALNYWPVPSVANIAGDDIEPEYHRFVNLIDFAALADDWLVDMPWPRP
jgi:hypothetical protein